MCVCGIRLCVRVCACVLFVCVHVACVRAKVCIGTPAVVNCGSVRPPSTQAQAKIDAALRATEALKAEHERWVKEQQMAAEREQRQEAQRLITQAEVSCLFVCLFACLLVF